MEKATIFSQVPRPPKQIWEEDAAIETVNKTQDLIKENDEKPSAITILKPTVEPSPTDVGNVNDTESNTGVDSASELASFGLEGDAGMHIKEPTGIVDFENNDLGDKSDLEPTAVIEAATDIEIQESVDFEDAGEQNFRGHNEPEIDIAFEENEILGDKSDEDPISIIEAAIDTETQNAESFEHGKVLLNETEITDNRKGENDFSLEIFSDIEPVTNYLKLEENKASEDETDAELDDIKIENSITELKNSTPILPKNINLAEQEHTITDVKMPNDEDLFKRQYYTMGEVATMFNANQSQIRFWENEFDILKPKKNKKGDRYFRPEDIKNLQLIHHLLRNKKFTIEGANEYLKNNKQRATETIAAVESLQQLKSFLIELKANL